MKGRIKEAGGGVYLALRTDKLLPELNFNENYLADVNNELKSVQEAIKKRKGKEITPDSVSSPLEALPADQRIPDGNSAKTGKELTAKLIKAQDKKTYPWDVPGRDGFVFTEILLRESPSVISAAIHEFERKIPDQDISQVTGEALIRWLYERGALKYVEGSEVSPSSSPIEPQDVSGLVEGINRLGAPFGIGQVTEERDGRIYLKDLENKKEWPYRHLYRNVIFFLKSSAINSKFPDVRQAAQGFLDGAGIAKELTVRPAEMGAEKPASSPVGEKRLAYEIVQKRYPFRMPHDRLAANQSRLHDDNNYRGRLYSKDYEFLYERLEGYINGYSGYHLAQDAFREMAKSMNMGDETIPKENLEILLSFSRRLRPPLKVLFDEVIGRDRIIKRLERFSPRDARSVIADEDRAPVTHTSLREYFGMTDDKRGINLIDKVLKEHGGNQPLSASASSPVEPVKTYETTDGQVIQLTGGVQIVGLNQDSSNLDKFYIAEESAVSFEVIPETAGQRTISIRFDDGRILSGVMRVTRLSEETHVSDSGAPYTLENFSDKHLPFFDIPPNTLQVLYKDDKGTPYFLLIYPPHARLWFGPAGEYVDVTNETHDFMRLVDQGKAVRLLEQVSHQNPGIVEIEKSEGGNIAFPSFGPDVHGDLVFYGTENYHGIERGVKVTITRDGKISKIFPLGITEEQIDRIVPVARAYLSLDSAQEQELKSLLKSDRLPEWPQEEAVQSTSKKSLVPIATGKELRPFSQKKFDRVTTAAVLLAGKYDFASAEAIGSVYQAVHSFLYSPQTNEENLGTALDLLLLQSDPSKKMEFQGVRMMREVREKVARQAVGMTNATGWIEEFRYRLRLGISLTEAERKPGGYSVYSKIILEAIIDPQRYVLSREELLKAIEDDFRVAGELKEKIETKYPGVYKVQIAQGWEGPTHFMRVDIRLKADASSSPVAVEKDARRRIREIRDGSVTEERAARLLDGLHERGELFLTLFLAEWMEEAQIDFKQYGEGKKIYVNESFEPGENILLGWGEGAIAVTKANLWRMTADLAEKNLEAAGYFLGEMEENLSATSSPMGEDERDIIDRMVVDSQMPGSLSSVKRQERDSLGEGVVINTSPYDEIVDNMPVSGSSPASKEVGGIDLNSALLDLQIKRDGNGVPLPLPMQPIENMHIEGFLPVIINVTPVTNLPLLLGLADTQPDTDETTPAMKARELELISALN